MSKQNNKRKARYDLGYRSGITGVIWGECFSDDPDYQEGFHHAEQEMQALGLREVPIQQSAS